MDRYETLFTNIFKQPLSHLANAELMRKTISEYPYFTPAHFYLLHLTDKSSAAFAEQANKTVPLFNNNYWLNIQLLELANCSLNKEAAKQKLAEAELPAPAEFAVQKHTVAPVDHEDTDLAITGETIPGIAAQSTQPFTESSVEEVEEIEESTATKNVIEPVAPTEHTAETESMAVNEPVFSREENSFIGRDAFSAPVTETALTAETIKEVWFEETIKANATEQHADYNTNETLIKNTVGNTVEESTHFIAANAGSQPGTTPASTEEIPSFTAEEQQANEDFHNETELPEGAGTVPDAEMEQISLKMAETLAGISLAKESIQDTVTFEPLHTSDYFASVGIKLSEEVKPADKLGLQLKSFTEWLKTMKKIHADQLTGTSSPGIAIPEENEKNIQALAEASNKENEILTEAMAEVFQQQGKTAKAIEVFEKLSLLNPSKMIYFTAKIKQLKD